MRQIREERGIELGEVQQHTKIRTRYLEAIEEGKLELLPGTVYAKGFIRSYADYLGVDGQALMEEFGMLKDASMAQTVRTQEPSTVSPPTRMNRDMHKSKAFLERMMWPQFAAGIGILAVLVAGYAFFTKGATHSDSMKNDPAQTQASNEAAAPKRTEATPPVQAQPKPEEAKPSVVVKQTQQTNIRSVYAVSNTKQLQLQVSADDQCWVQVTADGKVIFTGMLSKGTPQTWTAAHSLVLLAGNSPVLHIQLNGQAVAPANHTGGYTYDFQLQQ
ncbi:DUF4115 domain-containing protein [Fodinisporobacter ferrooxydans]|uniref:DUF4115 domain-containing protein n=1 Tax=Fodinisporobacter ferrooxydans TaxID=2901836 RepID=A0ABY4CJ04_9BACL|nr:DUF4115 domain-containing protein [Alicyclobacillaceae bacterium MYW30-H2]